MSNTSILIVNNVQHATILAALRVYQMVGGSSLGCDIENIASNGGAFTPLIGNEIDELCESINQASPATEEVVEALKDNDFKFGDVLPAFGDSEETSPYVKAARQSVITEEGSLEVDEMTVVAPSEGGAYVMAWIWVADAESSSFDT